MSGRFVLEAIGGLGNRMRALDSAIGFCKKYDKELHLVWPYFKGLNCPFESLFEVPKNVRTLSSPSEYSRNKLIRNLKVARRKIAAGLYRLSFDKVINKKDVYELMQKRFNFNELSRIRNLRIQTDQRFYSNEKPFEDFRPVKKIRNEIDRYKKIFGNLNVIGVHIRRTDHIASINCSPTEKFIDLMREELEKDSTTRFFVATDSAEEEEILTEKFSDKIITYKKTSLNRESIQGIQDALIDMYLLANTNKIIGSFTSSFSEVAAEIGKIPLIIVGKDI